jgi:hypothetical protein
MQYKWVQSFEPNNNKATHLSSPCLDGSDALKIKKAKSDSSLFTSEKTEVDLKRARRISENIEARQHFGHGIVV